MNQEAMKISNSLVLRAIDACTQGNCKALMLSIERLLGVLHVKHLVLSAAEGAEDIWLSKFGFNQISNLQLQKLTFNVPMMMFSGSSILGKDIMPLAID
jgi:hypothetical protein